MARSETVLRNKDVLAGILFLVMAGIVAYGAARLPFGTATRMGAGYFPMLLAGLLALFGAITLLSGIRNARPEEAVHSLAWSRVGIVTLAVLFFVFALAPLGFLLTIFGTTLIATLGNRVFEPKSSLLLAVAVSAVSWVLFAQLLNLPFRAVGSWFAGW